VQDGDETKRARTMFLTYEATDGAAETFMVVIGSIAENFRGVEVAEFQDDTVFTDDGEDAMAALHRVATAEGRLTDEQREELDRFKVALSAWEGEES
jgi:hypothetical protein